MGRGAGKKKSSVGLWIAAALVLGTCGLFFYDRYDRAAPVEEKEATLEKEVDLAVRSVEDFHQTLLDSAKVAQDSGNEFLAQEAKLAADECKTLAEAGNFSSALRLRPKWLVTVAHAMPESARKERTANVLTLTSRSFFNEIARNERIFVKFHRPSCGWCKKLQPVWTEASREGPDGVQFSSANLEHMEDIGAAFEIERLPTLMLFVRGRPHVAMLPNATAERINNWANFRNTPPLQPVTSTELDQILDVNEVKGQTLLVSEGSDYVMLSLYEDAAEFLRQKTLTLKVTDKDDQQSKVMIMHVQDDGTRSVKAEYTGPWEFEKLYSWLESETKLSAEEETKPSAEEAAGEL